jgi:PTH1 family peptidyl-tRNA hydrolase
MNLSGLAVRELLQRSQLEFSQCLVIYDDVSLSLGTTRLRPSGGAGGHRGMQSILRSLGTEQIPRFRIGIGGKTVVGDLTSYVLDRFSQDELVMLKEVLDESTKALEVFLGEGIERAMTLYNKKEG